MRLAALYTGPGGESSLHVAVNDGFVPVDELARESGRSHLFGLRDVKDLFDLGDNALDELRLLTSGITTATVTSPSRLASPVRHPSKIVCVGLNYMEHIQESGGQKPNAIVLFAKFPSCVIGNGEEINHPVITRELDYEGELGIVIGRRAKKVSVDQAFNYIGGFTVVNDVSARDLQIAESQWIRGKALDTFAPIGPVVVDVASAPAIADMRIVTRVNGEIRQDASCALMITSVSELIAYISQEITLEPGDVIATGTPSGVGLGMDPPTYLSPGDLVEVEISGIGTLSNRVVAGE